MRWGSAKMPGVGSDKDDKKRLKAEWKTQKMRHEADKKRAKADAKIAKKRLEAGLPPESPRSEASAKSEPKASRPARFADAVRGGLYLLLGASLLVALFLGQRDAVLSLDDLIEGLFLATAGKIVLAVIGVALAIYGLRKLGLLR